MSVLRGKAFPGDLWADTDTLLASALTLFEAGLCPGCHNPLVESTDPANDGAYEAPLPVRCHGCTAVERRAKKYAESEAPGALRFGAWLKAKVRL